MRRRERRKQEGQLNKSIREEVRGEEQEKQSESE
jgi:hypothetical protein